MAPTDDCEGAGFTTPTEPVPILARVDEQRAARGRRLARSTAIFALATGLSRMLGLVREIVASYYFGAAGKVNAFTVAFQVPNLFRSLVADAALSSAFVPVFSELLEKGERKRAWRVASTLFWLMLLGLGALTALLIIFAPLVIAPFGDPGGDKALAITLSRILFPIIVLLGVSGMIVGILNSYDHFTVPALSPVFWNLAIIVGLVLGVPRADSLDTKLYVYAISIVIGTVIQVLLPLPWLRGLDGRLQMVLDWRDPAIRRVFTLMVPVTIGLGLINFNLVIDSIFASRLIDPELAPSAIDKAFRIYMLPQGMFSVAVATVLFPSLSRLAARGDVDGFRHMVGVGLRQIAFLLVPASVFSAVLAEPIVRLIYQRGEFAPDQTPVVAGALAAFAFGLIVQRDDADAEPRLLQPPVALDPDRGRAREPRPQRRARLRPSTASARGASHSRRPSSTSPARQCSSSCSDAASGGSSWRKRREPSGSSCFLPQCLPQALTGPGVASTRPSDSRSPPRSSRSAPRLSSVRSSTQRHAGCWASASCTRFCRCVGTRALVIRFEPCSKAGFRLVRQVEEQGVLQRLLRLDRPARGA